MSPAFAVNNYNYLSSAPKCTEGKDCSIACDNPMSEYGYGILDVPQRLNIAPVFELPFGSGKTWGQSRLADLIIGGWIASATMSFQSGFPINVQQPADSRLGGQNANRPNLSGADLDTVGRPGRATGVGGSSDRDLDRSSRIPPGGGGHVRQCAADDYRYPDATTGQRRRLVHLAY